MQNITFTQKGFRINGEDAFLVSGEFHYFRVPANDWKRRMQLFKEAGGNCLATYVPWIVHEPEEGQILFDDVDYRNLTGFLEAAQEMDLQVILRPGPYSYSELRNDGLPSWLVENYPEILATDVCGKVFRDSSVSYNHPVFLEKARRFYKAFAEVARPFMAANGGPVTMLQVDNELAGIHLWFGTPDYNPRTMGFGQEDGRYAVWLRGKYGSIELLNEAYGTEFLSFGAVQPVAQVNREEVTDCRRRKDYEAFYRSTMAEYLATLTRWLREDGLQEAICHNSGTPTMNCLFPETVEALGGESFLLASDHYYNLDQTWPQNNPTPQYAIRVLKSCDTLRAMGMPPVALELPAGSCSDVPPILANDLLACYMTNVAVGLKGLNYYIFTGGPNVPDTGVTCDLYDYGAPVRADGSLHQDNYGALKQFGDFLKDNSWLQQAKRAASVQIGFEWNMLQCDEYDWKGQVYGGAEAGQFIERGLLYTLFCSRYSGEMVLLTGDLDVSRPLIVPCASAMSAEAREAIVKFAKAGGHLLLLPVLPEADREYRSADGLQELFDEAVFTAPRKPSNAVTVEGVGHVYGIKHRWVCKKVPAAARVFAVDDTGAAMGFEMPCGKGKILWFGADWKMTTFPQAKMLEYFVELLGGEPCVESSNRNVFTTLWMSEDGKRELFVLNLCSSPQETDIRVYMGGEQNFEKLRLEPMEVRAIGLA